MLFTGKTASHSLFARDTIQDGSPSGSLEWIRNAREVLILAFGVLAFVSLCLLFQPIAPDFHLLPGDWSWNLVGGLNFGLLLGLGLAYVPVVFAAYLIPLAADGSMTATPWPALAFAAGNAATFGIVCYTVRRLWTGADVDLEDRRTLMVIAALIPFTALLTALFSTINWWFSGTLPPDAMNWWFSRTLPPDTFIESFLIKAFGNGMGLLAAAPFVLLSGIPLLHKLANGNEPFGPSGTRRLVKGAVLLHVVAGAVIINGIVAVDRFETYLLLFVPLLLVSLMFGLRGLAPCLLVVGCAKAVLSVFGYARLDGLFMETPILVALISTLIVASFASERIRMTKTVQKQSALIADAITVMEEEVLRSREGRMDLRTSAEQHIGELAAGALDHLERRRADHLAEHERLMKQLETLVRGRARQAENRLAIKDFRG